MEKQRTTRLQYISTRLLIGSSIIVLLSVWTASAYGAPVHTPVSPNSTAVYAHEPTLFTLFLAGYSLAQTELVSTDFGPDVSVAARRLLNTVVRGVQGVLIELWLEFARDGVFELSPLVLTVQGERQEIPFLPIFVEKNEAARLPHLVLQFENGISVAPSHAAAATPLFSVPAGTPVHFSVVVQGARTLMQCTWDIPEHALFTERALLPAAAGYPLTAASFEWIPLIPGVTAVPSFSATVIALDDTQVRIESPAAVIMVDASVAAALPTVDNDFASAFTAGEALSADVPAPLLLHDDYTVRVAQVRSGRQRLRRLCGSCGILCGVSALLAVILTKKKRRLSTAACAVLCALSFVGLGICLARLSHRVGIFTGGPITAIPEAIAEHSLSIASGEKIRIVADTAGWYCITSDAGTGWVQHDAVIPVE
ncbi:MAG: hypothetical protein IJ191_02035 [Treponema sp.]|nr:hypothetical protein [Treponema sp.]